LQCWFLDALGNHERPDLLREERYGLHQRAIVADYTPDELPVDLDVVEAKSLQQGKVAVFSTGIVDGKLGAAARRGRLSRRQCLRASLVR
jgi:hypothetical protein